MKKIEVCEIPVTELKFDFGNPRKISKKKKEELKESLEEMGDFGSFIIDEHNNVIAGNQRAHILQEFHSDAVVLCKRLIGYTKSELRAINLKDNVHAGEWDLDALADWTADLNLDLGVEEKDVEERTIPEMELIHYEKYDYVMIVCRNEIDYNNLVRKLGIEGKKVSIAKRKIKGRAIWYDDMICDLVPKEEKHL